MEVLKIKLTQKSANYRVIGTLDNRMTYPLPPFSTLIGAIHNACNWKEYHELNIGIVGKYDSMTTEFKHINYLLDNTLLDRGSLTKVENNSFNNYSKEICSSIGGNGANFLNDVKTIYIYEEEFENFKNLRNENEKYKTELSNIKNQIKELKQEKKKYNRNDKEYECIDKKIKLLIDKQDLLKNVQESLKQSLKKYKSKQNGTCHYEILNNVELIIYISASEQDLKYIKDNIYNLTAIGRSEDFVDIIKCEIIELKENINQTYTNKNGYNSYIDVNLIKNYDIILNDTNQTHTINTTVYNLCKDYKIQNGKRVFNKKKVVYVSDYEIEESCDNIFIDDTEKDGIFIVNLL